MAFTDDKYYIEFADVQGRTHTVKLFPDGYTGSSTELVGAESPISFAFGSQGDDEFRAMNETVLEIRVIVEDETLWSDIFGDDDQNWVVDWLIGSNLAWRGYLLTDDLLQPLDTPSILNMRAVCGLAYLNQVPWTPGTSDRQTFMEGIQDALNDLSAGGVTLDSLDHKIGAAANWHAYDATAANGNSFARYEFDENVFENESTGVHYTNRFVIEQLVGRFGAKITNANGRWRIYQRELMDASSYSMDKYTAAGADEGSDETISEVEITPASTNPILEGGAYKGDVGFSEVPLVYSHGTQGGSAFVNLDFKLWSVGAAAPVGWTRVRENAEELTRNTNGTVSGGGGIHVPVLGGGGGLGVVAPPSGGFGIYGPPGGSGGGGSGGSSRDDDKLQ